MYIDVEKLFKTIPRHTRQWVLYCSKEFMGAIKNQVKERYYYTGPFAHIRETSALPYFDNDGKTINAILIKEFGEGKTESIYLC